MSQKLTDLVILEVASNVYTFSKPFARFGVIPVGGRSTAIKLSTGDVWVFASTPLTDETKVTLDKMGPVKYIMAGDLVHHLFLGEFKKAYPEAKVIGVDGLGTKKKAEGLTLDGEYGKDPAGTRYGFEDEIKSCYFSAFQNKDVAFCHEASKSLIVADLFFNLPATEQYSKSKPSFRIPFGMGILNQHSSLLKSMLYSLGKDKDYVLFLFLECLCIKPLTDCFRFIRVSTSFLLSRTMKRDLNTINGWDFERIIMCHGDVIEKDGKAAWKEAFSKYQT